MSRFSCKFPTLKTARFNLGNSATTSLIRSNSVSVKSRPTGNRVFIPFMTKGVGNSGRGASLAEHCHFPPQIMVTSASTATTIALASDRRPATSHRQADGCRFLPRTAPGSVQVSMA